jgi:hypothetical protein
MATTKFLKIEAQTLMGNTFPTYFVDLVVNGSHGNLRATEDKHDARKWASEYAVAHGLRVDDETYVAEVQAYYKARDAAAAARYSSMSDEQLAAALAA